MLSGLNFTNILRAAFYVQKCFSQLLYAYSLSLYSFGNKKLAQKLIVKSWFMTSELFFFYPLKSKLICSFFLISESIWSCFILLRCIAAPLNEKLSINLPLKIALTERDLYLGRKTLTSTRYFGIPGCTQPW